MDARKIDKATDAIMQRLESIIASFNEDPRSVIKEAKEIKGLCDTVIEEADKAHRIKSVEDRRALVDRAIELKALGLTLKEVAIKVNEEFGVVRSEASISNWMREGYQRADILTRAKLSKHRVHMKEMAGINHPNRKRLAWIRQGSCIIVTSHKPSRRGYISWRHNGRVDKLHRVVCRRRHPDMGNLHALHSCDNDLCINPDHLRPGTNDDNISDKVSRGRVSRPIRPKLTADDVRYIRSSSATEKELSAMFNVDMKTVGSVRRRESWQSVQ